MKKEVACANRIEVDKRSASARYVPSPGIGCRPRTTIKQPALPWRAPEDGRHGNLLACSLKQRAELMPIIPAPIRSPIVLPGFGVSTVCHVWRDYNMKHGEHFVCVSEWAIFRVQTGMGLVDEVQRKIQGVFGLRAGE